jgi:hypothetical protein
MAALMGTNAVDSEVKKRADAIETHRDTVRPIQSYKHVFEATTAIGKFACHHSCNDGHCILHYESQHEY